MAFKPVPDSPVEQLVAEYRTWLVIDRGLAAPTVLRYENLARRFLGQQRAADGGQVAVDLTAADVVGFLLRESERVSVGAVKGRVAELRSLLRFLHLKGLTPTALASAVPPAAGWHDTGIPVGLAAADVQRLLDGCDRASPTGVRNFAILMLVARLSLRSIGVARLELGDIDWRAGEIAVAGKARRRDRLPLPHDVGQALIAYLCEVRPVSSIRQVFLMLKAPIRPIRADLVGDVTRWACRRAGLPEVGPHRLRHALATEMLRRGAKLFRDQPGTASPGPGHHRGLRQGRPGRASAHRPTMAGSPAMSALTHAAEDYLRLRRWLGHELAEHHRLLPRFVAYLEAIGAETVTIDAALAWAQQPDADPAGSVWPRRMTIARGFARHMASIDPAIEIPPLGLIPSRQRWRLPYIYTSADIEALMAAARAIRRRLPAATHETLIGLLAATGMRVGEAIRLDRADIDWAGAVLTIRESKFGKSRYVPISPSTVEALDRYTHERDRLCLNPATMSFLVGIRGNRVIYPVVQQVFRRLCEAAGIGADASTGPRIHGLRHTFAVRTLQGWYQAGLDVEAQLPMLSTYLGHRDPRSTYWYLSAAPELLALAAGRLELSRGVIAR